MQSVMSVLWCIWVIVAKLYGVSFEGKLIFVPILSFVLAGTFLTVSIAKIRWNYKHIQDARDLSFWAGGLLTGGFFLISGIVSIL